MSYGRRHLIYFAGGSISELPDDAVAAADPRGVPSLLVRLCVVDSPQMMLLMSASGQPHTPADTYRR